MPTMGVQESLDRLKQAQEIDREIHLIRCELESIPETIRQSNEQFEAEKSRMAQLEIQAKEIQLRQKKKEGELSEKEVLIQKYDSQLMKVKTNKEYAALQQEIAALKADRSILEDAILAILDEVDQVQHEVREERDRLNQLEKETEKKKEELASRSEVLKANLASLSERRLETLAQVPPEIRTLYDKIIGKKQGFALVSVHGEACGACQMELRPQLLIELKLKESLVVCENCSRILYLD